MAGTGNSTSQAGDARVIPVPQAGETPEASVYTPLHKRNDSDIQNVSASVGMLPLLVYPDPSEPTQAMPPRMKKVRDYQPVMHLTLYQARTSEWSEKGNVAASEVEQAWYVPQAGSSKEMSGQKPLIGHRSLASGLVDQPARESSDEEENDRSKSTLSVQLKLVLNHFPAVTKELTQKHLQLYVVKHMQMLANMGQRVPEVDLTEYIELYTRIFELELKEYMKRKEVHATTRSTATLADSVDYDAIRHQRVLVIAEVMDVLNAPQQVEES
ncbi:hypothetical protein C0995_011043 [Termitomyces sp. Mi166|nr:hypothetical protein C0995_011043 [Termitomyces sp. Mi166\